MSAFIEACALEAARADSAAISIAEDVDTYMRALEKQAGGGS